MFTMTETRLILVLIVLLNCTTSQNSSCSSINENNMCYISYKDINFTGEFITCDPLYPNCIIELSNMYELIHINISCPSDICQSCTINFQETSTKFSFIKGFDCDILQIRLSSGSTLEGSHIYAPDNSGSLYISADTRDSTIKHNKIYSTGPKGTKNLIVDAGRESYMNDINGWYVTGDLNLTCAGIGRCPETTVLCGRYTKCNIKCLSECTYTKVYSLSGTLSVEWYCNSDYNRACFGSSLICGFYPEIISYWRWDSIEGWYYAQSDCVFPSDKHYIPDLSCSLTTTDTCIIQKINEMDYDRNVFCDPNLPNCQIQLNSILNSTNDIIETNITCPSKTCSSCVIYCNEDLSCTNITIMSYNCAKVQLNIKSYQKYMVVYAPGNGGEFEMFIHFGTKDVYLENSYFYSVPGTKSMKFHFKECFWCQFNVIDGSYVTHNLTVLCNLWAICMDSYVICPTHSNAKCNIDCTGQCYNLNTKALEGTYDVNWWCNDYDEMSCKNSVLNCNSNFTQSSKMQYLNRTWQLENKPDGCVDLPSVAPTISPTSVTSNPTEPTTNPSLPPTAAPTTFTEDEFIGFISGILAIFIFIVVALICYYKYYKMEKKSIYIKNGFVIIVGIGEYDDTMFGSNPHINGYLNDLGGIDKDIENMIKLFHDELNFDIYPEEYLDCIKNGYDPKQCWTEEQLKNFLEDRAKYLSDNIDKYDGLIVVISSHGVAGNVCTSDYKTFSKIAIHRIFTASYPNTRLIPRLFIIDCCSGVSEKEHTYGEETSLNEEQKYDLTYGKNTENIGVQKRFKDTAKNVTASDIGDDHLWIEGQQNPDYRLALIEAANFGFQSKLRSDIGSYVIHSFYEKTMDILKDNKRKFIHEIFKKIQQQLHDQGQQLIVCTWNTDTPYIRFKRASSGLKVNKSSTQIEMIHTPPKTNNKPTTFFK
eukprot:138579_1